MNCVKECKECQLECKLKERGLESVETLPEYFRGQNYSYSGEKDFRGCTVAYRDTGKIDFDATKYMFSWAANALCDKGIENLKHIPNRGNTELCYCTVQDSKEVAKRNYDRDSDSFPNAFLFSP